MNQREIRLLWEVATSGSVTRAAERVHMTQPAASGAIRALEERLGFEIFNRDRRRLTLTPKGRALLPELSNASAALASLDRLAEDLRLETSSRLSIACVGQAGVSVLPIALRSLRAQWPDMRIVVHAALASDIALMVAEQRVDFGLVLGDVIPAGAGSVDISVLGLHGVMRPDCALAVHASLTFAQLDQYPYITLARQLPIGALTARRLEEAGFAYRPNVEVTQFSAACAFAENDFGVAILDALSVPLAHRLGLVSRPLAMAPCIPFRLIWPRGAALARYAESLRSALQAAVQHS